LPIFCFIFFWLKHLTLNVGLDNTSIVVLEKLIFLLIIKGLSLLYFCSSHSQEACNFHFFVSAFTSLGRHILMKNISKFLRKCLCQDGFRGFIQIDGSPTTMLSIEIIQFILRSIWQIIHLT